MTNKEAYENIGLALKCYLPDNLPKDTKDELQESWDIIRKELEVLDILKRKLVIEIGKDLVNLKEDEEQKYDYTCIIVNQQEREVLKEWLENDNNNR